MRKIRCNEDAKTQLTRYKLSIIFHFVGESSKMGINPSIPKNMEHFYVSEDK